MKKDTKKTTKKPAKAKKSAKARKRVFYTVAEAQNVAQGSRNACDDLFSYDTLHTSYEAARAALRESICEIVRAAYDGYDEDEMPDTKAILEEVLATENNDNWFWNGPDRDVVWNIIRHTV